MTNKMTEEKQITKQTISNIDKLDTKKAKFIELYRAPESGGNISTVCHAVGIARSRFYQWLDESEIFAKAFYDAKMEKADDMEQQLYQRGYEKSDTALIFWLKYNHPNYKEQQPNVQINFNKVLSNERDQYKL